MDVGLGAGFGMIVACEYVVSGGDGFEIYLSCLGDFYETCTRSTVVLGVRTGRSIALVWMNRDLQFNLQYT